MYNKNKVKIYNLKSIKFTSKKTDSFVKEAVMIFADKKNIFQGIVLDRSAHNFDIVLLKLPPKEVIQKHFHKDSEELVLVLKGSGTIIQQKNIKRIKINDLILLEENIPHAYSAGVKGMTLLVFHSPPMHHRST